MGELCQGFGSKCVSSTGTMILKAMALGKTLAALEILLKDFSNVAGNGCKRHLGMLGKTVMSKNPCGAIVELAADCT